MPDYRTPEPCKLCEKKEAEPSCRGLCQDCYDDYVEEKWYQLHEEREERNRQKQEYLESLKY
jgi:hypothetical protein